MAVRGTAEPATMASPSATTVFVSYAREDVAFVDRLEVALKASEVRALIDRYDIADLEDWWQRIEQLIAQADTVLFVATPESVAAPWCAKELEFAQSRNKRIAPIILKRVDDELVPPSIRRLNFLYFDDESDFDACLARLVSALRGDVGWIRKQTEFGGMAAGWLAAGRPKGLLLRPPKLEEAEQWISSRPTGAPHPTDDTRELIAESRRDQTRRRNGLVASLAVGLVIALVLLGVVYWQRNLASERQYEAEQARQLADESRDLAKKQRIIAEGNRQKAENQRRIALSQLLAIQARRTITEESTSDRVQKAAALAMQSIEFAREANRPIEQDAADVARTTLPLLPLRRFKHGNSLESLVVLKDGRIATGGGTFDGTIKIWSRTGGIEKEFSNGSAARALAELPDGWLASTDVGFINVWPLKHRKAEHYELDHGSMVQALAVLHDGRLVSAGGNEIRIWPHDTRSAPATLPYGQVTSLAVLQDGRLVSGDWAGLIKVWPNGDGGTAISLAHGEAIKAFAILSDGKLVSAGTRTIKIWPKDFRGEPSSFAQEPMITALTVLPNGRLVSGDDEGHVNVWPSEIGRLPVVLTHDRLVAALAVHPDGQIVAGTELGDVAMWSAEPADLSTTGLVFSLAVLKDGTLVSGGSDRDGEPGSQTAEDSCQVSGPSHAGGEMVLWTGAGAGKPVLLKAGFTICAVAVMADGRIVSGHSEGDLMLWPSEGMGGPKVFGHHSLIKGLAALPDGRLVSAGDDSLKVWTPDRRDEPIIFQLPFHRRILSFAVLADGQIATGDTDGVVTLWSPPGRTRGNSSAYAGSLDQPYSYSSTVVKGQILPSNHGGKISSLIALQDGRLASGGYDGAIKMWPRENAIESFVHGSRVDALLELSNHRIVSGGYDGLIKLWSLDHARDPITFQHGAPVSSLALLPDGRLASSGGGKVKIWIVEEDQLIALLCLRFGRTLSKDEWARYIGTDLAWSPACRNVPSNWREPR